MGPLWLDLAGYELSAQEKEVLAHPNVGGVILFARNYHDNEQLLALTQQIRQAAQGAILIGVDQEGGRVQRFRDGFTRLPAAAEYAKSEQGVALAQLGGWLMATELMAHGIDLSFAPVLDRGFHCPAIGDRAFGEDTETVIAYSQAYLYGMKAAGMATTGKHFPGHGAVLTDTHYEIARDERQNLDEDLAIFKAHLNAGLLDAMMPAHVIYPHYDSDPASGSHYWLTQVLRQQLGFKGIIFSDDLGMQGAAIMGDPLARAQQALAAGCDMLLFCNQPEACMSLLDQLPPSQPKAEALLKKATLNYQDLYASPSWEKARQQLYEGIMSKKEV